MENHAENKPLEVIDFTPEEIKVIEGRLTPEANEELSDNKGE